MARRHHQLDDWLATLPIAILPVLLLSVIASANAAGPALAVAPAAAPAGTAVVVVGTGFERNEVGLLHWDGVLITGASYRTNGRGQFELTIAVPPGAVPGTHSVTAVAMGGGKGKAASISAGDIRAVAELEILEKPSDGGFLAPEVAAASAHPLATLVPEPAASSATPTQPPTSAPTAEVSATPTLGPTLTAPPTPTTILTPSPALTPPPSTVSCPASLQALVDAASAGSTLTIPPCTYRETVTIAKPMTLVTVGGKVDGEGVRTYGFVVGANDVSLDGFEVTGTVNPAQDGAVRVRNANRFTLRNASIHHTGGACISIKGGSGHRVVDSELAYCAQEGFHLPFVSDMVVARNRIHHNNPDRAYDSSWEAGGGKAAAVNGLIFESNEVYSNRGPGLWCDIDCRSVTFRDNRVHHNEKAGIFVEISDGALITGNQVWENGWKKTEWGWGAGILLSSSRNVDVHNNVVAWNADGISVISQNRSNGRNYRPGVSTWTSTVNINVHDNDIVVAPVPSDSSGTYLLAWLQDWSGVLFDPASNNRGAINRYWHPQAETTKRFAWSGGLSRVTDFNATPGETEGRYLTLTERDAVLAKARIPSAQETH